MYSFTVGGTFSDAPLAVVSGITDLTLRAHDGALTLYAAGRAGGGLLSLNVTSGISLRDYVTVPTSGALSAPSRLGVMVVNGQPSVILTGPGGTLIGGYRIDADGSLGAATVITGTPTSVVTAQASLEIGANQFFYTAPQGSNAIIVGQISAAGAMTPLQTVSLGPVVAGRDISALTPVTVAGQTMLVATSAARDEIDIYSVATDGRLTLLTTFGVIDGLWVDAPADMAAVVLDGMTYLVLAGTGSSSLTVLRLDAAGTVAVVDHVIDTLDTRFEGVQAVAGVMVAGRAFVLAGGADDGLNLFALMPDGRLVLVSAMLNAPGLGMTNVTALAAQASGNGIDVFVAGEDAGITRLRVDLGPLALPQTGTAGADVLTGGAAGDQLYGGAGADALNGGAARDILSDGEGADTLTGGADADIFVMSADGATDTITDFQLGVDRIDLSEWGRVYDLTGLTWAARATGFALSFGDEMLEVQTADGQALTAANFVAADFFGLWHLTGAVPIGVAPPPVNGGNDLFSATAAADILDGGEGFDTVNYANATEAVIVDMLVPGAGAGFAAGDVFVGIEEVLGSAFSDLIRGTNGNDVLQGMNGNDTLEGRSGNDSLFGGAGRDVLRPGTGASTLNGGNSIDTVDYALAIAAVQVDLGTGVTAGAASGHVLQSIEHVIGSAFGDLLVGAAATGQLYGGAGNDLMYGVGGNDLLSGDDGNDTLLSGVFAEILVGGDGYDVVDFSLSTQGLRLELQNTALSTGFAAYDGYQTIEGFSGSNFGDTMLGSLAGDHFYGGAGDDVLSGLGGNDLLFGDDGNDTLIGSADAEGLNGGAGFDLVDYGLAASGILVDLRLAGPQGWGAAGDRLAAIEAVAGSVHNDAIFGSAGAERLSGGAGNDDLRGYGGNDTLMGEDGTDVIFGSTGRELLSGGAGFDLLYYSDAEMGFVLDLLTTANSTGIAQGDTISGFELYVGSAFNDTMRGSATTEYLFGNSGNDILVGNGGNDCLFGEDGNDTLQAGIFAELHVGGAGTDLMDFGLATAGFVLDLQNNALSTNVARYDTYIEIEIFCATDFSDTLRGSIGVEVFSSFGGDDVLEGRGGNDSYFGGAGNDTIMGSDGVEYLDGGDGVDTVDYSNHAGAITLNRATMAASSAVVTADTLINIEAFTGTAFNDTMLGWLGNDILSGGAGADYVTGEAGADALSGGEGQDTLLGGAGDDTLWGDGGADYLHGQDGFDLAGYRGTNGQGVHVDLGIWANNTGAAAGDLLISIEGLVGSQFADTLNGDMAANRLYGGGGADYLWGRGGNDSIFGDDGTDTLSGAEGNDVLIGGAGADQHDGGDGSDLVVFEGQAAVIVDLLTPQNNRNDAAGDTFVFVEGFSGSDLGDGFYGNTDANLFYGQGGNDALVGRGGNDVLVAGAGDDFVNGGTGLDQMYGGAGADRFVFGKGDGADLILDFSLAEGDQIQCMAALFRTAQSPSAIVQQYGSLSGGNAVLDFGSGDKVTLVGVSTLSGLWQAIQII